MSQTRVFKTAFYGCCMVLGIAALWLSESGGSRNRPDSGRSPDVTRFGAPPLVRLDLLRSVEAAVLETRGRNIFGYYAAPVAIRENLKSNEEVTPTVLEILVEPDPPEMLPQNPDLGVRRPRFEYIGFIGEEDQLFAVFDKGSHVALVQPGDVVDDRFEVLDIRRGSVMLKHVQGRHRGQTLRLDIGGGSKAEPR